MHKGNLTSYLEDNERILDISNRHASVVANTKISPEYLQPVASAFRVFVSAVGSGGFRNFLLKPSSSEMKTLAVFKTEYNALVNTYKLRK